MLNSAMVDHDSEEAQLDVVIDPSDIPDSEWRTIRRVANELFNAEGKENYTKCCVQAYFEWLEFIHNQTKH